MKKILISVILSCFCFSVFAGVFIQQNDDGVGGLMSFRHDCFNTETPDTIDDPSFTGVAGFSATCGWEFNSSKISAPVHFSVGFDVGVDFYGLSFMPVAGFSWNLLEIGNFNLELDFSTGAGYTAGILGGMFFKTQNSLDVLFMKNNRKGFYSGLGITNVNFPVLRIYKDYGTFINNNTYIGAKFFAGFRF
ncbi:MAG: hypothetical protein MJ182_03915 [Treponema sp.]|nr:hypothetical protein [Treponema sp.]